MSTKAQLSVFFIIGLILLLSFATTEFFSFNQTKQPALSSLSDPITLEISNFIEGCLTQAGEQAVYDVLLQGGYHVPFDGVTMLETTFPYYWYIDESAMPTKEEIELELSSYIYEYIYSCFNDFSDFTNKGLEVSYNSDRDPYVSGSDDPEDYVVFEIPPIATITPESVDLKLTYPLDVKRGTSTTFIDEFSSEVTVDLMKILFVAQDILNEQQRNPDYFPIGTISILAAENGFTYETFHFENEVVLSLIFPVSFKEPIVYGFSFLYDWEPMPTSNIKSQEFASAPLSIEKSAEDSLIFG